MTAESKPVASFPAQSLGTGCPCVVEIHDNGFAYVRSVRVSDLPGHDEVMVVSQHPASNHPTLTRESPFDPDPDSRG